MKLTRLLPNLANVVHVQVNPVINLLSRRPPVEHLVGLADLSTAEERLVVMGGHDNFVQLMLAGRVAFVPRSHPSGKASRIDMAATDVNCPCSKWVPYQ